MSSLTRSTGAQTVLATAPAIPPLMKSIKNYSAGFGCIDIIFLLITLS